MIEYKGGYKYQLHKDTSFETGINIENSVESGFIFLSRTGTLTIKAGYAWDGCSGPTLDTKNTMRAGLAHDALYQLIRADKLSQSRRKDVDMVFHAILLKDKVMKIRAWYYYQAVRKFGLAASSAENRKKVHTAP